LREEGGRDTEELGAKHLGDNLFCDAAIIYQMLIASGTLRVPPGRPPGLTPTQKLKSNQQ
jgi:hypothetical protein